MEIFQSVLYGFQVALQPINLIHCFLGVLVGTLVGVLPGLGPTAAIALLLPATFKIAPVSATIMLAGIYYGAMYGGSTTSILVNIPGEAASVVTCLDGYQMARRGRAGPALVIAAFASFVAGTFAVIALTLVGPLLSRIALKFGLPEFFSLMIVGIMVLTFLSSGSMIRALMAAAVGLLLAGVAMDPISGKYRFTFNLQILLDGVGLVGSGDHDPHDGLHGTFDCVVGGADIAFYGYCNLFFWANLWDREVQVLMRPSGRLDMYVQAHSYALASPRVAWYSTSLSTVRRDPTGASGTDLGGEIDVRAVYRVHPSVELMAGLGYFGLGAYVSRTGADRDALWLMAQVAWSW